MRPGALQAPLPPGVRYHTLAALVAVAGSPVIALCPFMTGHGCTVPPRSRHDPNRADCLGGCGPAGGLACSVPPLAVLAAGGWGAAVWVGRRVDAAVLPLPDARCSPLPPAPTCAFAAAPCPPWPGLAFWGAPCSSHPPYACAGSAPGAGRLLRTAALPFSFSLPRPLSLTSSVAVLRTQPW